MMANKKGDIDRSIIIQIILIVIITIGFLYANASKINGRGVRQNIIESQISMLIEASEPGMSFAIDKLNSNGIISDIKIKDSKVFVTVDGLTSSRGKTFFSIGEVSVRESGNKFLISVS